MSYVTDGDKQPQSHLAVPENPEVSTFCKQASGSKLLAQSPVPSTGAEVLQSADLVQIIRDIVGDEYDAENIKKLCRMREGRCSFSLQAKNIGVMSSVPTRVFQVLKAFVESYRAKSDKNRPKVLI